MEETTIPFLTFYFTDYTTYYIPEDPVIDPNTYNAVKILNILIYSITFILGVIGNGVVIWIAGFKMTKTVSNIWFLNLAIADFVFDVFFPLQITEWIMDGHWPFGQAMCKVIFTALFLNMSVSTTFLMVISIDRCTSVMCPVWSKNHKTLKMASTVSIVIWSACFILSSPYLAFFDIIHDSNSNISYCIPIYSDSDGVDEGQYKAMLITRLVIMFIIPFSIILICYSLIVIRLRRRTHSKFSRPFKVIVTIVSSFFCLWFPFHLWPFLEYMNVEISATMDFVMSHIVYAIGFFNSCVNPMVYAFIGRDFKKSLVKSIPFLLESTFQEKIESAEPSSQNMVETEEMTTIN
ncbi:chemerin-like receptor 1 [Pyxicephalus adspersus]